LGNVGNLIIFQIGGEDEEILLKEFSSVISQTFKPSLTALKIHEMLIRLAGQEDSRPYIIPCPPPLSVDQGYKEKIIKVSREKYCQNRLTVEERIERFFKSKRF